MNILLKFYENTKLIAFYLLVEQFSTLLQFYQIVLLYVSKVSNNLREVQVSPLYYLYLQQL